MFLRFVCVLFLLQRADKTEQDCLVLGDKCADVPGTRGEPGNAGEDGGYAGYSGKCERVTSVGHKREHLLTTFLSKEIVKL